MDHIEASMVGMVKLRQSTRQQSEVMCSQCNTFEWMYELDESWKNNNQATEGRVLSIRGMYDG
jgi:hypothetical protein